MKQDEREQEIRATVEQRAEVNTIKFLLSLLDAERKRVQELQQERDEECQAHDEIGKLLLPIVGTADGTSVSCVKRVVERVQELEGELRLN